jgi:5-methyltetrahydrofolate--homocysteine methyltransferase
VRRELGIQPSQGRRYSWGYPACPDQSEHEKVFRLLDAPQIGLSLSGGYAIEPEQSTLAIVAHHPQAIYFGMKSGRLSDKPSPDQIIADPRRRKGHRIRDGVAAFDDSEVADDDVDVDDPTVAAA